jgi:hypothetical protein
MQIASFLARALVRFQAAAPAFCFMTTPLGRRGIRKVGGTTALCDYIFSSAAAPIIDFAVRPRTRPFFARLRLSDPRMRFHPEQTKGPKARYKGQSMGRPRLHPEIAQCLHVVFPIFVWRMRPA